MVFRFRQNCGKSIEKMPPTSSYKILWDSFFTSSSLVFVYSSLQYYMVYMYNSSWFPSYTDHLSAEEMTMMAKDMAKDTSKFADIAHGVHISEWLYSSRGFL